MNKEEAITELSDVRSDYNCFNENEEPKYHALSMAIEALQEKEQKTGKWIDDNGNRTQQYRNNFKCSECGHYQHTPVAKRVDEFEQENKFCHWCGARMEREEE